VTIEFDSNTRDLPWRFKPVVSHVTVHPGEVATVELRGDQRAQTARSPGRQCRANGPASAGEYFARSSASCFQQQTLAAGETRRMPVTFVIDPKLPKDVSTIALSYTFSRCRARRQVVMETVKTVLAGAIGIRPQRCGRREAQAGSPHRDRARGRGAIHIDSGDDRSRRCH